MNYQRFEALLKSHGTSVYRLAKATGISNSTFTDWKNGRSTPKADKLKHIADYFSVPVDYLIGSDAERSAEQKSYKAAVARENREEPRGSPARQYRAAGGCSARPAAAAAQYRFRFLR